MSEQPVEPQKKEERTWIEEVEVAGTQLVERVKEIIGEGNVRRLIIRNADGHILLEIPLTAGVVVGGALTMFSPLLAALGAMAALVAKVRVEVIRTDSGEKK
jgi:hypothetical protein